MDLSNKAFLKTLRMLRIIARRFFRGQKMGARTTNRRGTSVEFSDYKEYNPGDDIRFIDWNIYGRLDKLLVKLFYNEENLHAYVLLDCSASMNFGSPSKFDYARQLAAAIAYVAASNGDAIRICTFADGLLEFSPKADRAAQVMPLFRFLESRKPEGRSNLDDAVSAFQARFRRRGVIFVISDLMVERKVRPEGGGASSWTREMAVEGALKRLVYHKHDVNVVQVLTPDELDPSYAGLWEFTDAETGEIRKLTVTTDVLRAYREAMEEYVGRLARFSAGNRVTYLRTGTDVPFENLVLRLFAER